MKETLEGKRAGERRQVRMGTLGAWSLFLASPV